MQVMDGAREEWPPEARPLPGLPQPPRARLAQQVYLLQRGGCIVRDGNALPEKPHEAPLKVPFCF